MLKTLKHETSYETLSPIIQNQYADTELVDYFSGSLNDNYLFENVNANKGQGTILGRKHKPRKYIIIYENYLNEWSSDALVVETDSETLAKKFLKEVKKNEIPLF